ncbi:MAG: (2Fe-2S)-binding protein [Phycisphaerae bacterium]
MEELRCICHDTPMSAILRAARQRNLPTVDAVVAAELAGTGCGSCKPYLERMLATGQVPTCADALRDAHPTN